MVPGQNVHDADQKECEAETVRSIAVHCHDSVSVVPQEIGIAS